MMKPSRVPVSQEKSEEIAYLAFATAEFREMKMNTYLERALRNKDILKA